MGYWENKLEEIVGGTIMQVLSDEGDFKEEPWVGLLVSLADGKQVTMWLLSDEEGNAPGRFQIDDVKETSK